MLVHNTAPGQLIGFDYTPVNTDDFFSNGTTPDQASPSGDTVRNQLKRHLSGTARQPVTGMAVSHVINSDRPDGPKLVSYRRWPDHVEIFHLVNGAKLEVSLVRPNAKKEITKIDPSSHEIALTVVRDEKKHGLGRFSVWHRIVLKNPAGEEHVLWPGYKVPEKTPKKK